MKKVRNDFIMAGVVLLISIIFTILVSTVDVQPSGISGTIIPFSTPSAQTTPFTLPRRYWDISSLSLPLFLPYWA